MALVAAVGSACSDSDDPGNGTLVEGDGYQGVLLDAHIDYLQPKDGPGIDEGVRSFVPSEDDVARFEDELPDAAELRTYFRQYTGVAATDGDGQDHRQLVVQGVCASAKDDGTDWEHGWVEVADGGTCFWDATLDLRSGDLIRFGYHGDA
jgi:hypothetical protein